MKYIKCPRCELNYMPENKKVCDICEKELNGYDFNTEYCVVCGRILGDDEYEICKDCKCDNINDI